MKRLIAIPSILALFAGSAMANVITVDGENVSDIEKNLPVETKFWNGMIPTESNYVTSGKILNMTDSSYNNISITIGDGSATESTSRVYGGIIRGMQSTINVDGSIFNNIKATAPYQIQGGAISQDTGVLNITNSKFSSNKASSMGYDGEYNYAAFTMGGAVSSYGSSVSADNAEFNGNSVNSYDKNAMGGAIYFHAGLVDLRGASKANERLDISISNSKFVGNYATVEADMSKAMGGAIYLKGESTTTYDDKRSFVISNTIFSDNYAGRGGAIYTRGANVDIKITDGVDRTYAGNYSTLGDQNGGFLMIGSLSDKVANINFNIQDATLTIGNANCEAGYDSIASADATAVINKLGAGALVVNGSMEYFAGTLNVNEGSMTVNSTLGAANINVANGATLSLGDNSDIILYACSITVEEGATLNLGENTNIVVNLTEDSNGSTNLFNVQGTLTQDGVDGDTSVVLAGLQDNITVTYNGEVLDNSDWAFDAETGKLVANVPEAAEVAAIFGAIALAFIAYRRRK